MVHAEDTSDARDIAGINRYAVVLLMIVILTPIIFGIASGGGGVRHFDGKSVEETLQSPSRVVQFVRRTAMCIEPAVAAAALLYVITRKRPVPVRRSPAAFWVAFSFVAYSLALILCIAINSPITAILNPRYWTPILVVTAFYQLRAAAPEVLVSACKTSCVLVAAGSLAALVVIPDSVSARSNLTFLPGIDFRLHGPLQANSLAFFMGIYLLLADLTPRRGLVMRSIAYVAVLVTFLLTQSKTMLLLLLAGWFVKFAIRCFQSLSVLGRIALAIPVALVLLSVIAIQSGVDLPLQLLSWTPIRDDTLVTFTGRSAVWNAMIDDWKTSPFVGFGADLWKTQGTWTVPIGRESHVAGHAHSQYVQTLWESGLLGFSLLMLHLLAVVVAVAAAPVAFRPHLGALAFVVICRSLVETTIAAIYMEANHDAATYVALLAVLFSCCSATSTELSTNIPGMERPTPAGIRPMGARCDS